MRKSFYTYLILSLFVFSYLNSSLSAQEITHVEIYPENPTNADEVLLIVSTSFPLLNCSLDSVHRFYACGASSIDAFYNTGFELGDCERTDTINLGNLNNGLNIITYRMYYLGWSQVDQVDTAISVGTTGISGLLTAQNEYLSIWPVPSHGKINIQTDGNKVDHLRIVNANGSFVSDIDIEKGQTKEVKTMTLLPGLYICTAFNKGRPVAASKFIVLDD